MYDLAINYEKCEDCNVAECRFFFYQIYHARWPKIAMRKYEPRLERNKVIRIQDMWVKCRRLNDHKQRPHIEAAMLRNHTKDAEKSFLQHL